MKERLVESRVRLTVIGRRDRLPVGLGDAIAEAEALAIARAAGIAVAVRIGDDIQSGDALNLMNRVPLR